MKKNISNDANIANFRRRKFLRYGIIITSLMTIILAFLSLTIKLNIIYALVVFLVSVVLQRMFANTELKVSKEVEKKRTTTTKKTTKNVKKAKK